MSHIVGWADDSRITLYTAVITRDYPHWTATITGGDLPEPGHIMTSFSYARLCDEAWDWLSWHLGDDGGLRPGEFAYIAGPDYNPLSDDLDEQDDELDDDKDDDDDEADDESGPSGFSLDFDHAFSQDIMDALERYWAARKAESQAELHARDDMSEPVCIIADQLRVKPADMARMLGMEEAEVQRILDQHDRELLEAEQRRYLEARGIDWHQYLEAVAGAREQITHDDDWPDAARWRSPDDQR